MAAKFRVKFLVGSVLVVAVVIATLTFRSGSSRRAVEAYKQQLRAQGEKLAVSELVPVASVGSWDNAQGFMSAMGLLRTPSNYPPTMKMIAPGRAMVAWQQEVLPEDKVSNIWPGLLLQLQATRGSLSNLHTALDAPVLYFKLDYSQGWGILLPHLAKLKQAEILAAVSSVAALHERNYPEAWTNLQMAVTLTRRYQAEPILISHLVRIAMAQIAMGATWEFLQSDRCTEAQLAELQSDWQAMEFFNGPEAAFVMERAIDVEALRAARDSYDQLNHFINLGGTSASSKSGFFGNLVNDPVKTIEDFYNRGPRYWAWRRSWSFDEELFALENYDSILKAIRRTELNGAFIPALKELDANTARINKLHSRATNHFMLNGLDGEVGHNSLLKFADTEVGRRLLVVAIALKRHHLRHGNFPAELKSLAPEFMSQVPVDLMDGQSLRYQIKPDGSFLLYSVGEDGEDNGGDGAQVAGAKSKGWLKARDIVWPQPATPVEISEYFKTNSPAVLKNNQAPPDRRGL